MSSVIYGLATLASRSLTLATTLAVTYSLSPHELGLYVLTLITAFALSYLFGSWLSASAYHYLAGAHSFDQAVTLSCMLLGLFIAAVFAALTGYWLYLLGFLILPPLITFLMCCLTVVMMIFDTSISVKNSMGKAAEFAFSTVFRSLATFILVNMAIWIGFGIEGALFAHIIAIVMSIFTPSTLTILSFSNIRIMKLKRLKDLLTYGLVGGPVLGYYMISNAITRNLVGIEADVAMAGALGVTFDLIYAPIALIGMALSYIHMPRMHASGRHKTVEDLRSSTKAFLNPFIIFTVPYIFGGLLVVSKLLGIAVGGDIESMSVPIGPYALIYASALSIFSAVIGALLAGRHLVVVIILIVSSLFLALLAVLWTAPSSDIVFVAQAIAGAMTFSMLFALYCGQITCTAKFDSIVFFKTLLSSVLMALIIAVLITLPQPYGLFLSIIIGPLVYIICLEIFGLFSVFNAIKGFFAWLGLRSRKLK